MNFKLLPVSQEDLTDYKKDMQEAFQKEQQRSFLIWTQRYFLKRKLTAH